MDGWMKFPEPCTEVDRWLGGLPLAMRMVRMRISGPARLAVLLLLQSINAGHLSHLRRN